MPEFCEVCGSIMRIEKEDKGVIIYVCPVCGWRREVHNAGNPKLIETPLSSVETAPSLEVIDETKLRRKGVMVDKVCPKCGATKVYVVVIQTRAADEPPTRIYHCPNCKYTWREYS